jgi:hypothetical protein
MLVDPHTNQKVGVMDIVWIRIGFNVDSDPKQCF